MKILVDACLSPEWAGFLTENSYPATHWSFLGPLQAADAVVFQKALTDGFWIFTHDLDFGTILAFAGTSGPSVIQARLDDVSVAAAGSLLLQALRQFQGPLSQGCILTILPGRQRVRILPLKPSLPSP